MDLAEYTTFVVVVEEEGEFEDEGVFEITELSVVSLETLEDVGELDEVLETYGVPHTATAGEGEGRGSGNCAIHLATS